MFVFWLKTNRNHLISTRKHEKIKPTPQKKLSSARVSEKSRDISSNFKRFSENEKLIDWFLLQTSKDFAIFALQKFLGHEFH